MKNKRLLIMLLLALFVPWAANAQSTLTVYENEEGTNSYVPIYGSYADADQHNQMIYPATVLATMGEGATISQMVFYTNAWTSWSGYQIEDIGSWTVKLGETTATTLDGLDETTTLTEVFSDELVCNSDHTTITITFSNNYTYNGGNLLVDITHEEVDPYINITFKGKNNATSASIYQYEDYYGWSGGVQDFLPRVTITHAGGTVNPCQKPTLAEATLTQGDGSVATLTWTENGEADGWTLQYGTDNTFATCTEVSTGFTISGSTITANLTSLTADQKYYARVKPNCDTDGSKWSNEIDFKPTNAIPQTVCDGTTTNSYIPVYGNYAENYNKDEFIIPATTEGMANMADGTISAMTFYLSSPASDLWGAALYRVFMKEVNESSFASTSYYGTDGATIVYEGALDGTQSTMTIEFTTDYEYNGGNLLIGIYEYNKGSYKGCSFYGITSTNGSMYKNNSTSLESITSGNLQNFIPKTTFTYLPTNTPKPKNLSIVENSLSSSGVTLQWQAPTTATPTGYEYQYKESAGEWPAVWTTASGLTAPLSGLTASKDYTFRVRAIYAEGESGSIETEFRTLDACAFPTNFTATTVPGVGTDANFSWVKGYDETAWVLQIATDADFTTGVVEFTEGFVVGNNVTFHATTLTPEQTYYAHVKANCGSGSTSTWSNVATFTPSNHVDFTLNESATGSTYYAPIYYSYVDDGYTSQFIVPAARLTDVAGGTVKRLTFYSTSSYPNVSWGDDAEFAVYVKEVENENFATAPTSGQALSFDGMTNVYSGSLSVVNNQMVIELDNAFVYNGGNLMIGFDVTTLGNATTVYWVAASSTYATAYSYYSNGYYSTGWSVGRSDYLPKVTFNYLPTPYKYPVIDEASCTAGTTSAHIAWTVTGATPTGYQYQYKLASATEWPTAWTSVTTAYADLSGLTPGSFYDFRVKALYDGGNESVVVDYSFVTECAAITAFPWKETFESYPANTSTAYDETYKFDHPCWVNEHLVDGTGSSGSMTLFQVCSYTQNGNSTHKLQLPDMKAGTVTGLRLPEMTLASGTDYQFVLDINRNTDSKPTEGIRVFVSTNGELEGATELCFISRDYTVASAPYIPAEEASGWYTYELPLGIQGTCYIILRGESQYGSATYMDNLIVEEIPTCARPEGLAYSDVTNHSATIEWTAGDAEQTLWQIAYSKTNFDPNTANFDVTTVTTIDATAHPFTLDKILDAASTYYVYVRANCGTATEPDYGPWNRKGISFTTLAATPAPSNFVASNPASAKVDLVWNAGGGDTESWEIYYEASETAPEAPTASTTATVSNITTLPTTEAPSVLEGLNPVTKYYAWIRAKHVWDNETTYSDWVALTGDYFETLDACPTPTDLVATNLTSVSADLSWVGSDDVTEGYTVEYGEEGSYSLNETEDFSAYTATTYSATGSLPEGWYGYSSGSYKPHVSNNSVLGGSYDLEGFAGGSGSTNNFLYMIGNSTSPNTSYTILPQFSDVMAISFDYGMESASYGTLTVGYCTDNTSGSTFVAFTDLTLANSKNSVSVNLTSADIALLNDNHGYLTFCWTYNGSYGIGIDNVTIKGGTYTPGATQIVTTDAQSKTLSGLTPNKTYTAKVKSNCTSAEWSATINFTTLAEGNKVFVTEGNWNTAANWVPAGAPAITDDAIIRANVTIPNGTVATAKKINFEGATTPTLTIADGGQLQTDNAVTATVKKNITGYGAANYQTNKGYCLIAPPFDVTVYKNNSDGTNLRTGTYDLYTWNRTSNLEWGNYGANTTSSLPMSRGTGYLYANQEDTEITFTGSILGSASSQSQYVYYTAPSGSTEFSDWNLIGNPFMCNAYLVSAETGGEALPYYKMNDEGDNVTVTANTYGAIAPMQGIFYQATAGKYVYFTRTEPAVTSTGPKGNLNILVSNSNTRGSSVIDNAIISFGNPNTLGKLNLFACDARVFIPQDGKDYAVAYAESNVGEMPLNFKAEKNGAYTLSFSAENVAFSYLHLIDNMTGADVDLLDTPSYSFDARLTDYASRFRLVFATGSSVDGDSFAFINGNGSLCIYGIDGTATLQVIDVMGRVLSSETFSGNIEKKIDGTAGVYMLRLINGNNVKVQKIVVR